MITSDGWLSWADRVPGPREKQYSQPNSVEGYVPHSMVGYLGGWYSRLFDMSRLANGRFTAYAAASVHLSILYDGTVIQHYPFFSSCFASGNGTANTTRIAAENEGGYNPHNEPLTVPQLDANIRIIDELSEWRGWRPARPPTGSLVPATLLEHNECVTLWGGGATACPSSRIPWDTILAELSAPPVVLPPPDEPSTPPPVGDDDMLELVATTSPIGTFLWITDWQTKHYIADTSRSPAKVLMDKGKWPTQVSERLPPNHPKRVAFDALERGADY